MEYGFVLMNLSKHKRWRAHRVIAKQQQKNRLILCVYTQQKCIKIWRASIQRMITKQQVKNKQIKKQTCSLCFVNVFKF